MKRYDVVVIGGGHNGLVAAALLAKRKRSVLVLERRETVGGAAITETPFGPDYKVTALAYVVSLLPASIVSELELERFGYHVYPQNGYFAPHRDGRHLMLPDDTAGRHASISRFSERDADAMNEWDVWLGALAKVMGDLLTQVPPDVGGKGLRDLFDQMSLAWRMRHLGPNEIADITRLMTMSIADLVEERFESPALHGVLAVSGIIGAWAGPRSPGTAYVMAHHKLGSGSKWGFPRGGMGAVTGAMRQAAEAFGATIQTGANVEKIDVRNGRAHSVVLQGGEEVHADVIITTTHPKIAFLEHIDRKHLPEDFVTAIERWKSRSGVVKVNFAVDRLPDFACKPGYDPEVHGGTIVLAESLGDIEGAFQEAVSGRAATLPFADICIPSVFDPTLAPKGHHIVSMFTQWVPHTFANAPHTSELEAYADRITARMEELAPGFSSSIVGRQIIGPHEMETKYGLLGGNIFHGELSPNQLFFLRPAPGYADFRTPIENLYQASSATHGGGGVTGIPAMQAVQQILRR